MTASFGVATVTPGTGAARDLVDAGRPRPLQFQTPRPQPRHPPGRPRGPPRGQVGGRRPGVSAGAGSPGRPRLTRASTRRRTGPAPPARREPPGDRGPDLDDIVDALSRALVLRDGETVGHSRRVTAMVLDLARALGVGEAEMPHIRRGALLHDVGKMGIPDAILHKPGPLTDDEWAVMRRHPELRLELLSPIESLAAGAGHPLLPTTSGGTGPATRAGSRGRRSRWRRGRSPRWTSGTR